MERHPSEISEWRGEMKGSFSRLCVKVVLVSSILLSYSVANAYVPTGEKWANSNPSYYINPQNNDVSTTAAIAAIRSGAEAWSLQTRANIRLNYGGTTTGNTVQYNNKNEIFFSSGSSGSTIAVTYSYFNTQGQFLDEDIRIYDGGYQFFTGTSGCTNGLYLEDILTHEFGHFIGLDHNSDPNSTMYPTTLGCSDALRSLSADDIAGAEALYPPTIGPTPTPTPSIRCDLNSSGSINVSDVQICVNQVLGLTPCASGDVDSNGQCNVSDAQRVVNGSLGGSCP